MPQILSTCEGYRIFKPQTLAIFGEKLAYGVDYWQQNWKSTFEGLQEVAQRRTKILMGVGQKVGWGTYYQSVNRDIARGSDKGINIYDPFLINQTYI